MFILTGERRLNHLAGKKGGISTGYKEDVSSYYNASIASMGISFKSKIPRPVAGATVHQDRNNIKNGYYNNNNNNTFHKNNNIYHDLYNINENGNNDLNNNCIDMNNNNNTTLSSGNFTRAKADPNNNYEFPVTSADHAKSFLKQRQQIDYSVNKMNAVTPSSGNPSIREKSRIPLRDTWLNANNDHSSNISNNNNNNNNTDKGPENARRITNKNHEDNKHIPTTTSTTFVRSNTTRRSIVKSKPSLLPRQRGDDYNTTASTKTGLRSTLSPALQRRRYGRLGGIRVGAGEVNSPGTNRRNGSSTNTTVRGSIVNGVGKVTKGRTTSSLPYRHNSIKKMKTISFDMPNENADKNTVEVNNKTNTYYGRFKSKVILGVYFYFDLSTL